MSFTKSRIIMLMTKNTLYLFMLLLIASTSFSQSEINGTIERKNKNGSLKYWDLLYKEGRAYGYITSIDSLTVQEGKYALLISEDTKAKDRSFGACALTILSRFEGKKITLKAYVKTENVKDGWAGLWMRINKDKEMLEFNNMQEEPILGTNDWKEYSITLPFNSEETKILVGGLLVGEGKAWFDNFRVFIDDVPIEKKEQIKK